MEVGMFCRIIHIKKYVKIKFKGGHWPPLNVKLTFCNTKSCPSV